jgi:hypothetical protein
VDTITYLRQFRLGGYAIFDFSASLIGMALLAPLLSRLFRKFGIEIPFRNWLFFTLPLSIIAHMAVDTYTPMTRAFLDPHAHYFMKLVVILSFALSFMDIKRIKH